MVHSMPAVVRPCGGARAGVCPAADAGAHTCARVRDITCRIVISDLNDRYNLQIVRYTFQMYMSDTNARQNIRGKS